MNNLKFIACLSLKDYHNYGSIFVLLVQLGFFGNKKLKDICITSHHDVMKVDIWL